MNSTKYFCQNCKKELKSNQEPCPYCGFKMVFSSDEGQGRESLELRQKQKGFKKFMKEIISGWFPSGDPKLKKGVDMARIIDKEKKEYHHIVKDVATGEVIHEEHEPLSQHKSQIKHLQKNVKKPKQNKEQRGLK